MKIVDKARLSGDYLIVYCPDSIKSAVSVILDKAKRNNNSYVTVIVENVKRKRSTGDKSQNKHLNGHIQQICEFTGYDFPDVKKLVKQRAIAMGYPMLTDEQGNVLCDPWGTPYGKSEADSTTEECSLLIEAVHILAAELDIRLRED